MNRIPKRAARSLTMLSLATLTLLAACDDGSKPAANLPAPAAATTIRPTELSMKERDMPLNAVHECNLERVNGKAFTGAPATVARSGNVVLSGWVADAARGSVPATVELRMVDKSDNRTWKAAGRTGGARADVKALLGGDAALAKAGFAVTLDPSTLPPGTYRAYLVFDGDAGAKSCDNGRTITIE